MDQGPNGSVNYYRKWKLISSEVEVKLKNRENLKLSKKYKIVVQIYWTHVRPPSGAMLKTSASEAVIFHIQVAHLKLLLMSYLE